MDQNQSRPPYRPTMSQEPRKVCRHCKTNIPKSAKVCPVCRRKQSSGAAIWIFVIAILLIVGLTTAGSKGKKNGSVNRADSQNATVSGNANSEAGTESQTDSNETDKLDDDLIFKPGETAEYKDIQVTLTNITETSGGSFHRPADGNIFILAEFEIANNSQKELAISSMLCFDAYQDGYSTGLSISALIDNPGQQLDGSVASGKKMKGCVGYEVPADYKELEINVQLDVWSSEKIVFLYEKQ